MRIYKNVDIEVEVDIEIDDVLEFINEASYTEIKLIREEVGDIEFGGLKYDNLYDREKVLILKKAMQKYNLDQLVEKLEITQAEAI